MSQQHVDLWNETAQAFSQRLEAASAEQMQASSPCEGWCAQEVVDHAVGTQSGFIAPMLGVEIPEGAAWPEIQQAIGGALTAEALEGMTTMPGMGEVPKGMVLGIGISDLLVHTWDVARATGGDESLPAASVSASFAGLQRFPEEMMRSEGFFGAAVPSAEGADEQTQMLNFAGRVV